MTPTLAPLQITRFWTDYAPDPTDAAKLVPVDKVSYGPLGRTDNRLNISKVSSLLCVSGQVDPNNPASVMAHVRADYIKTAYDAWKNGQDMPLNGTPLAAWNGITPEQADVFRSRSIRTVEEISQLNEATRAHIPLPNLATIIAGAKRFIDSADQTRFAAQMAEKDQEIASAQAQITDQGEQIAALMAKVNQLAEMVVATQSAPAAEPSTKRGRPSNAELAARQAAEKSEAA